jgi:ABC-type polysaccharide/polyol phosphate transport system ATPase subunit
LSPAGSTPHRNGPRPIAIEARHLEKSFSIPLEKHTTLKERALRPRSWRRGSRELKALDDVSFDVARGEFFGVVGRNGSGKSTLLKVLASIYGLDGGTIRVAGRLAPFIELGVGFNPELTARDNVILNGVMMGLSPAEARSRFDAVIEYAELQDYTELKLKNYSSGMYVRLGFSLMLQVDADILLVDEVLAVGDAAFQAKCTASLEERHAAGTTIVLVSHDMGAIAQHCERAMMIEDARIELIGEARDVAERYTEILFEPEDEAAGDPWEGRARVTRVWVTDSRGEETEAIPQGEPIAVNVTIRAEQDLADIGLFLELINNPEGLRIAAFEFYDAKPNPIAAGEEMKVQVRLANPLGAGNYRFSWMVGSRTAEGRRVLDRCTEPARLAVIGTDYEAGLLDIDYQVSIERGGAAVEP